MRSDAVFEERPEGGKPFGKKPGGKSFGGKPHSDRPGGDKPRGRTGGGKAGVSHSFDTVSVQRRSGEVEFMGPEL